MQKISRFFSGLSEACHPSKSSFSFAMDVIVIQRSDFTYASTPFLVKFGRFKLSKTSETIVKLLINDIESPIQMKLSKSGSGHFIRQWQPSDPPQKPEYDINYMDPDLKPAHSDNEALDESLIFEEELINPFPRPERHYRTNISSITLPSNNLNSEELVQLNLKEGINHIKYTAQGKKTKVLLARVFLWKETDKIVVSDIDGTLTKSDLMGHLCYAVGKDWSRSGVSSCYTSIASRNYKILYLTSRSVNQIESTTKLIQNMQQGGLGLPIGPLILSNSGMFRSLVRELANLSKVFKESVLQEILQLFPANIQPFWAGFGNRTGDAIAYLRSGVEENRIFIFCSKKGKRSYKKIEDFEGVMAEFNFYFPKLL
jgi:phosphatidate phosphatase PAH1